MEYAAEADRIERAVHELPVRLEHIGSTAVPGLSAKPIIDILAGVPPRTDRQPYVEALKQICFDHLGANGVPGRDFFRRGSPRSHHVHMITWNSPLWKEWLMFRDFL